MSEVKNGSVSLSVVSTQISEFWHKSSHPAGSEFNTYLPPRAFILTNFQWRSGNASHLYTTLGIKCEDP